MRMCVPLSGGVPSSTSERAAEMFRDVKVVWSSRTYITAGENCGGWLRNGTQMQMVAVWHLRTSTLLLSQAFMTKVMG